jgi:hypothetical protein
MEFEKLEVKVPINFLGTVGFSPRRDGRYRLKMLALESPLRGGNLTAWVRSDNCHAFVCQFLS